MEVIKHSLNMCSIRMAKLCPIGEIKFFYKIKNAFQENILLSVINTECKMYKFG